MCRRKDGCPNSWDCSTAAYCRSEYWSNDCSDDYTTHIKAYRWYYFLLTYLGREKGDKL